MSTSSTAEEAVYPPRDIAGLCDSEAKDFVTDLHSVWAVSWRGRGHRLDHTARQDAVSVTTTREGVVLAAVADGVGSQPRSAIGARLATRAALNECVHQFDFDGLPPDRAVRVAMHRASLAVRQYAHESGVDRILYASTLLLTSLVPQEDGLRLVASWTGDGMILVFQTPDRPLRVDLNRHESERPDDVTPVADGCGRTWHQNFVDIALPGQDWTVAVMTDGIADDFAGNADCLARVIERATSLSQLLKVVAYRRRGSSDDRSIVVVKPRKPCPPHR